MHRQPGGSKDPSWILHPDPDVIGSGRRVDQGNGSGHEGQPRITLVVHQDFVSNVQGVPLELSHTRVPSSAS